MNMMQRIGGRKIIGFTAILAVGGVLIYLGRLDSIAAAFLCGLYGAYVGGNASEHIAKAIGGFRLRGEPDSEDSQEIEE